MHVAVNITGFVIPTSGESSKIAGVSAKDTFIKKADLWHPHLWREAEGHTFYPKPRLACHLQQWGGTRHIVSMDKWQRVLIWDPYADQHEIWEFCSRGKAFPRLGLASGDSSLNSRGNQIPKLQLMFPQTWSSYCSPALTTLNLKWKRIPFLNLLYFLW